MVPALGMWRGGEAALEGAPVVLKYGLNYLMGFPCTLAGLLDPHVNPSGELTSSLDEE
jgi:hypothetical protein